MSAMDDLRNLLGPDLGRTDPGERTDRIRVVTVCTCGHLATAHGPGNGGSYPLKEPTERLVAKHPVREIQVLDGCVGEMPGQTFERFTDTTEHVDETTVITRRINATCPCTEFRGVAKVDRPHRYFNQRRPHDRADFTRHPLIVGMRAYRTRIGKLKRAQVSDVGAAWADAEFDRRFVWTHRQCAQCEATGDGVWPVFVDDCDTSELRCPAHR